MIRYNKKIIYDNNTTDNILGAFNVGYTKYSLEELKNLTSAELEREILVCENLRYQTGTREQLEQLSIKELMSLREKGYNNIVEMDKHKADYNRLNSPTSYLPDSNIYGANNI